MIKLNEESKFIKYINKNKFNILFVSILLIGVSVRIINLSSMPMGINQDEAFAGYEAYSIFHYGKDTYGYSNPVYLTAWGSGMNALYSYLTIPLIILNGGNLNTFIIRLPQCIMGIISLIIVYFLVKKTYKNRKLALITFFLLAINPWHIMLSRWGLEANIAPAFLILGLYFWILGIEQNKQYLILATIFYGLSLYCYAPMWIVVPIILLFQFLYSIFYEKIKIDKYLVIAIIMLFVIALPLMLFVLVNLGVINEIKTSFISIPKMDSFRSGEISPKHIKTSIYYFWNLMIQQSDNLPHNSINQFGIYYKFSTPLILLGIVKSFNNIIKSVKNKKFKLETFIFINIFSAIFLAFIMNPINVNKINVIHIPIIIYCSYGLFYLLEKFDCIFGKSYMLIYGLTFIAFISYYFSGYQNVIGLAFQKGYDKAIEEAEKISDGDICVTNEIYYPKILFLKQTPVDEFIKAKKDSAENYERLKIGRIIYGIDKEKINDNYVYVVSKNDLELFESNDYKVNQYDNFYVVYKYTTK